MKERPPTQRRPGNHHQEHVIMLVLILVVCLALVSWLGAQQPGEQPESWSWEQRLFLLYCVLAWAGFVLCVAFVIWLALAVLTLVRWLTAHNLGARLRLRQRFGPFTLQWFGGALVLILVLPLVVPGLLLVGPFWLLEQGLELFNRYQRTRTERKLA